MDPYHHRPLFFVAGRGIDVQMQTVLRTLYTGCSISVTRLNTVVSVLLCFQNTIPWVQRLGLAKPQLTHRRLCIRNPQELDADIRFLPAKYTVFRFHGKIHSYHSLFFWIITEYKKRSSKNINILRFLRKFPCIISIKMVHCFW